MSSGTALPSCRYWDVVEQAWSSAGLVSIGYEVVAGEAYVVCVATHLTPFIGTSGGRATAFTINMVDPVADAGELPVREPTGRAAAFCPRPTVRTCVLSLSVSLTHTLYLSVCFSLSVSFSLSPTPARM